MYCLYFALTLIYVLPYCGWSRSGNLLDTTNKQNTRRLIETIDIYQLKQVFQNPTRVTKDTQSHIDLFINNKADKIANSGVISLAMSDHSLIFANIKTVQKGPKPNVVRWRNFKKYNKKMFCSELENNSCTLDFSGQSYPNDMWND